MTPHSSILAWEIPWTEEPGGLQSMGSQRVGHDSMTKHALYSPGNDIQYPVINHNGKEYEKEYIFTYVYPNHFAVYLKLTQYCKSAKTAHVCISRSVVSDTL